ncbi:TPA: haloacid dehalogenase-like hydrolase, partial [Clostridioides difficile]|nr:haloacid dehalogenase-like hydrolase [Clostridioides difficile]HBH0944438.1 haloacid dehalogenase-like hydrolase [Clostridioides difficile]HCP7066261.1 haloacid dehalogenase-like hydrolase [Clostridioides difficile]HDN2393811.1 haloacid dehalogenase-like hydrolase [Clostridioides difficile]
MKKSVLLLDVDYTVINTDSMIDFFIYSLKNK